MSKPGYLRVETMPKIVGLLAAALLPLHTFAVIAPKWGEFSKLRGQTSIRGRQ